LSPCFWKDQHLSTFFQAPYLELGRGEGGEAESGGKEKGNVRDERGKKWGRGRMWREQREGGKGENLLLLLGYTVLLITV